MSDQLSLRLEIDLLPELPDLRPMLPRPLPEPFDSDEHLFEPWWGGARALVMVGPAESPGAGAVRIVDAEGVDISAALPELAGMAVRLNARSAILDGELVVVDAAGRADAAALASRLAGEPGRPAAFLAFDLLHLDGRSLLSQPLVRRREALRRVLRPGDEVVAVPGDRDRGPRALRRRGRAGDRRHPGPSADEPVSARDPEPALAFRAGRRRGPCQSRNRSCRPRRPPRPRSWPSSAGCPLDDET